MHLFVNLLLVVENRKNLKLLPVDIKLQNIRVPLFGFKYIWIVLYSNFLIGWLAVTLLIRSWNLPRFFQVCVLVALLFILEIKGILRHGNLERIFLVFVDCAVCYLDVKTLSMSCVQTLLIWYRGTKWITQPATPDLSFKNIGAGVTRVAVYSMQSSFVSFESKCLKPQKFHWNSNRVFQLQIYEKITRDFIVGSLRVNYFIWRLWWGGGEIIRISCKFGS